MNSENDYSGDNLVKSVANYFQRLGYTCRLNVTIHIRGVHYIADLVCEKANDRMILEMKNRLPTYEIIESLGIFSKFVTNAKWYLCIPQNVVVPENFKTFLRRRSLGLMIFDGVSIQEIIEAQSYEDYRKRLDGSLKALRAISLHESRGISPIKFREYREPYEAKHYETLSNIQSLQNDVKVSLEQIDQVLESSVPIKLRISSELLDGLTNLKTIAYSRELQDFEHKYRKAKSFDDEYQICLDTLTRLWRKYRKERGAIALRAFKDFEPLLLEIPGYRDHMIHPFQVFLLGSIIIDNYYHEFQEAYAHKLSTAPSSSLDFAWLLCSSFHDFCYPIQMYETINKRFFSEFLQIKDAPSLSQFQTEKILLRKGQMKLIDQLVSIYCHYVNGPDSNWVFDSQCQINEDTRFLFMQKVTEDRNHAPLSAITLLNTVLGEDIYRNNPRPRRFFFVSCLSRSISNCSS